MKKIVFVLVVLLFTAPAWATVTIDANQVGDTNQVEISYVSDGNLPRAFGLDITVSAGNIIGVIPAMVGECTVSVRGFGIFPGTIDIAGDGTVNDWGNPDAPPGATGALGGLDTNGITIEMGSLYEGPNSPPSQGLLCTIIVEESCTVNIAGNAARCGEGSPALGVVMEDPDEIPDVTYVPGVVVIPPCLSAEHFLDGDMGGSPLPPPMGSGGLPDNVIDGYDLDKIIFNWGKTTGTGMDPCADCGGSPLPPPMGTAGLPDGICDGYDLDKVIFNWGTSW